MAIETQLPLGVAQQPAVADFLVMYVMAGCALHAGGTDLRTMNNPFAGCGKQLYGTWRRHEVSQIHMSPGRHAVVRSGNAPVGIRNPAGCVPFRSPPMAIFRRLASSFATTAAKRPVPVRFATLVPRAHSGTVPLSSV